MARHPFLSGDLFGISNVHFTRLRNDTLMAPDDYDTYVDPDKYGNPPDKDGNLDLKQCSNINAKCKEGLLIPLWNPTLEYLDDDKYFRACLYIVGLIYMFIGLSVVTERFMTAIDVIISQKKQVPVKMSDDTPVLISVKIWSQTVANVTLVALGSSASEILLTIIEVYSNDFQVGYIGPCAIISSAAYSLFMISAICVFAVPVNKVRKIKRLPVYLVTTAWSIFAYIWLFVIVHVTSKNVIEIWEAVLTFACFPAFVYTAYLAEKAQVRTGNGGEFTRTDDTMKAQNYQSIQNPFGPKEEKVESGDIKLLQNAEKQRNEITFIIGKIREVSPHLNMMAVTAQAKKEILNKEPKSRAFYGGTRKINYWPQIMKETEKCTILNKEDFDFDVTKVFFESDTYAVLKNASVVNLTVVRRDGDISKQCQVTYKIEEGTAKNVQKAKSTICFKPMQLRTQISIGLNPNKGVEEDDYFYVHLSNPQLKDENDEKCQTSTRTTSRPYRSISRMSESVDGKYLAPSLAPATDVRLCPPYQATVTIVDSSHSGIFYFPNTTLTVEENCGDLPIKVCRGKGGNGRIRIPYHPIDGTAELGVHYQIFGSDVIFENNEYEKKIMMRIINKDRYIVEQHFYLALEDPQIPVDDLDPKTSSWDYVATSNPHLVWAVLGPNSVLTVNIRESKTLKSAVDNILKMQKPDQMVGPTTWLQQLNDAITVNTDVNYLPDDGDCRYLDLELPTFSEYALHFVSLTWKLFAALLPPTTYCNGWACFFACLVQLGILTTIVVDLATSLGCTLGFHNSFTAVSLVAIGISLPDTFSCKTAAIEEAHADAAIGNIPACNAVAIFLGLGIAWTIAAIYHGSKGTQFAVPSEYLAPFTFLFCVLSFPAFFVFLVRRWSPIQGELGGPNKYRILTSFILTILWLVYLSASMLVIYCVIRIV